MRLPFALTAFLAAGLGCAVQPLAGKAVLPAFGGSPAVWTTCLVFFQFVLLLGYRYAHELGRLRVGRQVGVHAILLAAGGLVGWQSGGPLADDATLADWPVAGVLVRLARFVFLPAVALAATAPLVQRWFVRSRGNPYPLYAASNAGSLLGLLAYPFLIEPRFALDRQFDLWLTGYAIVAGLLVACGLRAARWPEPPPPPTDTPLSPMPTWRWLALAALPSSLLASVTGHLTTDIAPVPLFWVVPLALYLGTFVIAFGRWSATSQRVLGRVAPMAICFLAVALLTKGTEPVTVVVAIHLTAFVLVTLLCHGELARTRPPAAGLTHFYFAIALGGVLGGAFNAMAAPVLFASLGGVEYPLAICLAGLVRPPAADGSSPTWLGRDDVKWLLPLTILAVVLVRVVPLAIPIPETLDGVDALLRRIARYGLTPGIPVVLSFALVRRPGRFAVALAMLFVVDRFDPEARSFVTMRNSLGTLRVGPTADGRFVQLTHGTTRHGQQYADEPGRPKPLMYYHPTGPAGRLLERWPSRSRVGAVGLGCGALAGYGRAGEAWTFYELDPNVVRIARDDRFFTFLSTCPAAVTIELGDARRQLRNAADASFDVLILDAFNSDAVPTHLLTREAFDLYFRKLTPDGVLLVHASNRYLDLPGLIARTCADRAVRRDFDMPTDGQKADGKFPSDWLAIVRDESLFAPLAKDPRWQKFTPAAGPVWTDAFTDLLGIWKRE